MARRLALVLLLFSSALLLAACGGGSGLPSQPGKYTVKEKSKRVVGYDVTYRLSGKEAVVRTTFRPGATLPVKDGQVVVTAPEAPAKS